MELGFALLAAMCFAVGGLLMKWSEGLTRWGPTVAFVALFAAGALLQAWAMRRADMGAVYVAVLGLEAVLALGLSLAVLHERMSWQRAVAVGLVLAGVVLLRKG